MPNENLKSNRILSKWRREIALQKFSKSNLLMKEVPPATATTTQNVKVEI